MTTLMDLADGSLSAQTKEERLRAQLLAHSLSHIMYPPFFERSGDLPPLHWVRLDFCENSKTSVPKTKGVYAFVLEINKDYVMPVSHVLYIGKAGDLNSKNYLRKRYGDYLRYQRNNDRPRISPMLNMWKNNLAYYYAVVDEKISTGIVEKTLLDILSPPYNRGDYSAELASLLKGVNII